MQIGNHTNTEIEEGLVRHMVLNALRSFKQKFSKKYGELIIVCDDKHYWRKDIFRFYKASRKKNREQSEIDWNNLFNILNTIRDEINQNMPYKVIQVPHCEADDIIATIAKQSQEDVLILSADKDFKQLQIMQHVKQYDPINKKDVVCDDPSRFLLELIIRGDSGDGIPNVLSPDNSFVDGIRQKPISKKKIEKWIDSNHYDGVPEENLNRNRKLIDFDMIPESIHDSIVQEFENQIKVSKNIDMFGYFVKHRLKMLVESIGEF